MHLLDYLESQSIIPLPPSTTIQCQLVLGDEKQSLTLTCPWVWWGRCGKNYLPKEEGREGGEKSTNPGPAPC